MKKGEGLADKPVVPKAAAPKAAPTYCAAVAAAKPPSFGLVGKKWEVQHQVRTDSTRREGRARDVQGVQNGVMRRQALVWRARARRRGGGSAAAGNHVGARALRRASTAGCAWRQVGNKSIEIGDDAEVKHSVYVYKCTDSVIQVGGRRSTLALAAHAIALPALLLPPFRVR